MKKILFVLSLTVLSMVAAFADDGGSLYPEDWTYGNIYVSEPNQKIALENEILEFGRDRARAIFDFNNTTAEKVKVPCSFPVVMKVPFKIDGGMARPNYSQLTGSTDSVIWEIALNRYLPNPMDEVRDVWSWNQTVSMDELLKKDKSLRIEKYDDYIKQLKSYKLSESRYDSEGNYVGSEKYGDGTLNRYSGCKIVQDGKNVPILNVGVEVSVDVNPKSQYNPEDWSSEEYSYLNVVLHFYHVLEFKPSVHSKLEVEYEVSSLKRSYRTDRYEAFYDISTGGTWKGSMKNFLVATDMSMEVVNGGQKPKRFDEGWYYFKDYKPKAGEYFAFSSSIAGDDGDYRGLRSSDFPKQDFVKDVKASSFLSGSYKLYDPDSGYYGDAPVVITSDYSPATCFDTNPYNGWVEGVKGDGVGEWISFTLTKKVFGPFATNGLVRFNERVLSDGGKTYDAEYFSNLEPLTTWEQNNRVKKMRLTASSGKAYSLDFEDSYSGFCISSYWFNRDLFNTVKNPSVLDADSYKMQIYDVYKGTKYSDTVLGQVWFIVLSDGLSDLIDVDKKLDKPIFRSFVEQKLRADHVFTDYGKNWLKEYRKM